MGHGTGREIVQIATALHSRNQFNKSDRANTGGTGERIVPEELYVDYLHLVESEKIGLIKFLNTLHGSLNIETIPAWVENLNTIVGNYLIECIARNSDHLFRGSHVGTERTLVWIDGVRYGLTIIPDIQNRTCLALCLIPEDFRLTQSTIRYHRAADFRLEGDTQFSSLSLDVPNGCLLKNRELLIELCNGIFGVGHNWISEKAINCIREVTEDTNRSLYEYMRTITVHPEMLNGFVFSALMEGKDFVALDEFAVRGAVSLAKNSAWKVNRSPADLAVQAMTQVIPDSDSVIADVMQNGRTLDIDLTEKSYYHEDESFSDAMQAVWGSSVSCFPILSTDRLMLVALFRTEFKTNLEPILSVHKECLREIALTKIDRMKKLLGVLAQAQDSGWPSVVGALSGTFAANFFRSLSHH